MVTTPTTAGIQKEENQKRTESHGNAIYLRRGKGGENASSRRKEALGSRKKRGAAKQPPEDFGLKGKTNHVTRTGLTALPGKWRERDRPLLRGTTVVSRP